MNTIHDARQILTDAWPNIVADCRTVLGSELHYQAMIYHCLRIAGVPIQQLGMNVKMDIKNCQSELFKKLDLRKNESYRGGFEPIPDVVIFSPDVEGDWRRRRPEVTLRTMLLAIEVKASERAKARLGFAEIARDIDKLAAHREEAIFRKTDFLPVMMIIDTAPMDKEQMTESAIGRCTEYAHNHDVPLMYLSRHEDHSTLS